MHLIVPYPAGGVVDLVARAVTDKIGATWGQPFIVEDKPGANGNIGAEQVKNAPADGYTLLMGAPFLVLNPLLDPQSRFIVKDFAGVGLAASPPNLLVVPATLPVKTLREFVDYARTRPGQINAVNPGTGTSNHLCTEVFMAATGIEMTLVGYKGQPQALADLFSGQLQFMCLTAGLAVPHIKSGKLRALAINTDKHLKALPEVPTMAEAGYPGTAVLPWYGFVARAGTPRPIIERLNAEINIALKSPDVIARLDTINAEIYGGSAADFDALIKANRCAGRRSCASARSRWSRSL